MTPICPCTGLTWGDVLRFLPWLRLGGDTPLVLLWTWHTSCRPDPIPHPRLWHCPL